jgi:transforming growth factor-beta-induced protein
MKKESTFKVKFILMAFVLMLSTGSFAQTVYGVIDGSPNHTSLKAAIDAAGLATALQDATATYTVFAPDNAAFDDFAAELGTTVAGLLLLPQADLQAVLLYHVLDTEVGSGAVTNGAIVTPLNPANTLKLTVDGTAVFVNHAQVNAADLPGTNGVVHSIDAVVLSVQTVADIAIGSADHTTLVAAVIEARLLPALTDPFAALTVFAPTDAAFTAALTALGITAGDLLASPDLTNILLYHVLGAEVESGDLTNGQLAQPLNASNTLKVTIDGTDVFVNQAPVTGVDIMAENGVVHVLGAVVLPNETVADIAIGSADHTTLVAAVIEARLLPALTDPFAELTVFAPTDAAFNTFLTEAGISAGDLLASPDLTNILLYHVLGSEVESGDLVNGPVVTLSGGSVSVDLTMGVMINDANVTGADNLADNGVVHVIDAVLIDPTASLEEINNLTITMYPNPATDFITINSDENGNYTIIDIMGAVVANGVVSNDKVNVSSLNSGTYFVNFTTATGVYQGRFVKN